MPPGSKSVYAGKRKRMAQSIGKSAKRRGAGKTAARTTAVTVNKRMGGATKRMAYNRSRRPANKRSRSH